ncbi:MULTISPECIES: hypothetical protein [unclassified Arthrobacter]|uniref:hypothetical protein n=1 Tax=unclassified Arthrobacter TaxID=235627 RepID=UPI0028834157|nr:MULTISPECIES: hypothetical protein [unclassified Arthrobacter]
MKTDRTILHRAAAATLAGLILTSVATAAVAAEFGDDDVDVNVEIAQIDQPGVLAMTVAGTSVQLTEGGSTPTIRQFTGTLPTVTVTDTRTAAEIPDGSGWYVLGTSTDFTGDAGQPTISAGNLGWTPRLIDGGESGQVAEGDHVDTVLDSGDDAVGLVDQELLALASDSEAIAPEGQWTANAQLVLKTASTVQSGSYGSTLTLSLFE